jgi:hypothetical protein
MLYNCEAISTWQHSSPLKLEPKPTLMEKKFRVKTYRCYVTQPRRYTRYATRRSELWERGTGDCWGRSKGASLIRPSTIAAPLDASRSYPQPYERTLS